VFSWVSDIWIANAQKTGQVNSAYGLPRSPNQEEFVARPRIEAPVASLLLSTTLVTQEQDHAATVDYCIV